MPKHLYIHIPFCNAICTYCDFKRYIKNDEIKNEYVARIIHDIKKIDNNKFDSIYIGGGTPNCLSDSALSLLLNECKKHCSKKTEFTIECNPESVNDKQVKIFIKNNVNRVSLGVQTTNNALLKRMNRKHNLNDVKNAIKIFRNNNLNNISCDFIYGFNEIKNTDLKTTINFINEYKIPHVSFYSLETKPNSILTKTGYKIKEEKQESDLKYIESHLKLSRYEISN
jgi:oxygen-independent coproporphyrinogen-3 oxidase